MNKEIFNYANLLTISRLFLLFPLIYFIYLNNFLLIFLLFILIVVSDILDGFVARKFNQKTYFGEIFDILIDAIVFLSIFFVLFSINNQINNLSITWFLCSVILGVILILARKKGDSFVKFPLISKLYAFVNGIMVIALLFKIHELSIFLLILSILILISLIFSISFVYLI